MQKIGKHVARHQYLHICLRPELDETDQRLIEAAARQASVTPGDHFNVIKLAEDRRSLTLLDYPGFFEEAFPILRRYWTVDLKTEQHRFRTYEDSNNPPILHRKELLLPKIHESFSQYAELTKSAEDIGLFDDPNRIGFLRAWEALLQQKGFRVVGHDLVPVGNAEETLQAECVRPPNGETVARHLTALTRYGLSAPMQTLARFGYLDGSKTIFDYGCGKGGDLETLRENNLMVWGWDPYYAPENEKRSAHIVNLGFVINVIENFEERIQALVGAYELADQLLVVSAMIANQEAMKGKPYGDGVLTSRNTFQKYFTQSELSHFLAETLGEEPVAVAPGVFYVFKDKDAEQRFMYNRFAHRRPSSLRIRRSAREHRPRAQVDRVQEKYAKHGELLEPLWQLWLQLGRKPERSEVDLLSITQGLGSLPAALRLIASYKGEGAEALLEDARKKRIDDLRVYFAQLQFERRKVYRHLDPSLKNDIKTFFGSLKDAMLEGQQLLFDLSQAEKINLACQQAAEHGLGWLDESHSLQLHTSLVEQLPPVLRSYVSCGTLLYGDISSADLIKIHIRSGKLTLMKFDDFVGKALPRMLERVKINLRTQKLDFFDYGELYTPPYLYLKSRFINEEFPHFGEQQAFDEKLETLNLFDFSEHGPEVDVFDAQLEARRYQVNGFELERSRTIPNIDAACGQFLTYRDLIECGETQTASRMQNFPTQPATYTALLDLAAELLDPIIDYFGMIKLTFGFCSPALAKNIKGRIAPKLDQHAAHERNRLGKPICDRKGAAVDFVIEDEDMVEVSKWIAENLRFDRMYVYGVNQPLHLSFSDAPKAQITLMTPDKKGVRLIPKTVGLESYLEADS
ncbi:DNA phosphorothioation-associated putative methyltransferase [Hydrocarboniclastica marina]|uniref:DNA phosphorothioation-associated putative methyltransferase n=1 Tax=Hydrocarboniclastica marina TaxID=2259620 RepID=A0A4P7XJX6_9ALTE|nr:DNA phosphorothioation-associated putative methyltransferase [Hydrocarboniclastica marina]QCF27476.1 DNA phosphorothioation-associated putative methyltransferase [Hydrocarboniclastica marina]